MSTTATAIGGPNTADRECAPVDCAQATINPAAPMEVKALPIAQINPAAYNPRLDLRPGDEAYERLKRSITTFGYVEPVIVNQRTGNLVGGHQRLKVLKDLGHTDVQAVVVDLSPEQEKLLNVALNKVQGDWDQQKLAELLDELTRMPEVDVTLTGFDLTDVRELIDDVLGDGPQCGEDDFDVDAALDASRPAVTKAADLIELGRHRLLCGDSTNPEHVRRLNATGTFTAETLGAYTVTGKVGAVEGRAEVLVQSVPAPGGEERGNRGGGTAQQALEWQGTIPAQKWTSFYMKMLTKFAAAPGLEIKVHFRVPPRGEVTPAMIAELKNELRDLGLDEDIRLTDGPV